MGSIGPEHFRAVSCDSTGNTTLSRDLAKEECEWIIILPDSCHRMDKLCKDIAKIKYFQPVSYVFLSSTDVIAFL